MSNFARMTRYNMPSEEILINLQNVRAIYTHKGHQCEGTPGCVVVLGLETGDSGYTEHVNESLSEIISKIDEAESGNKPLAERRSSHYVLNGDTLEVR